ncbi:MAG: M28 family peptidase, partial [Candidatus Binatia bacterium]
EEPTNLSPGLAAYLNMDMIGRLDKALIMQGVGSSSVWTREIERHNAPVALPIVAQDDSYLPTDATSFYLKGVPILNAFTGAHEEYHTPRDTADKINYPGTERIARFLASVTRSLATREDVPDYIAMKRPAGSRGRARMRVYLGTIPDYARGDVTGVKLSGVVKGGPAERAGAQGGDTIVELASKKIENIYDYTYALDALKIGAAVEMVVLRGDRRVKLTVTPESRE